MTPNNTILPLFDNCPINDVQSNDVAGAVTRI